MHIIMIALNLKFGCLLVFMRDMQVLHTPVAQRWVQLELYSLSLFPSYTEHNAPDGRIGGAVDPGSASDSFNPPAIIVPALIAAMVFILIVAIVIIYRRGKVPPVYML